MPVSAPSDNLSPQPDWIVATAEEPGCRVFHWSNQLRDQMLRAIGTPTDEWPVAGLSLTRVAMVQVPPGVIDPIPQRMVMAIDLSEPIDTLAIDTVRRFARFLPISFDILCIDDRPDASQHRAAWHIRDLLRYQSGHHTIHVLSGSDVATDINDYLTQQRADLLILSSQLYHRLFPFHRKNTPAASNMATGGATK